jgi:hypothetical protein
MRSPRTRVKSPAPSALDASPEGSIAATLVRTVVLVGLTVVLMALCRMWGPAKAAIVLVAGTRAWQSLYDILRLQNGLQREQLLLVGIALSCFVIALCLQTIGLLAVARFRRARADRQSRS